MRRRRRRRKKSRNRMKMRKKTILMTYVRSRKKRKSGMQPEDGLQSGISISLSQMTKMMRR
jgi:hypothetical protein